MKLSSDEFCSNYHWSLYCNGVSLHMGLGLIRDVMDNRDNIQERYLMLLYHCFHFCTSRWSFWYGLHLGVALKHHTLYIISYISTGQKLLSIFLQNIFLYFYGLCANSSNGSIATIVKFRSIRFRFIICFNFHKFDFHIQALLFDCWFVGNIINFVMKMHLIKISLCKKQIIPITYF